MSVLGRVAQQRLLMEQEFRKQRVTCLERYSSTYWKTAKDTGNKAAKTRHTQSASCPECQVFLGSLLLLGFNSWTKWCIAPLEVTEKLRAARSPQNVSEMDVFAGQESNQIEHIASYGQGPGFYSQRHRKAEIPENGVPLGMSRGLQLTGMAEHRQAKEHTSRLHDISLRRMC